MSSSFEKSVKGGTKIKLAPPKSKYVEHISSATQSGEAGVAEVFRTLQNRLRDSTWTIVFKSLIIVHLMIKEGAEDVTLRYLSTAPKSRLAIDTFTDVQTQGQNIRRYSNYLKQRAESYRDCRVDHVRVGERRMKTLSIEKGLLRETGSIQDQIKASVKCDLLHEPENEISLMAFRLLTRDLLDSYAAMNEAVINILKHYFELSKVDAEHAIEIYKVFVKQTDLVVQYLSIARQYEHATRLEIPKIKHAPTSLAASSQEYSDDTDFDTNRRQFSAEQQGKKSTRFADSSSKPDFSSKAAQSKLATTTSKPAETTASQPAAKGPAPDLIDFFDSIEQNQTPMAQFPQQAQQQQQYQQPNMQPIPTGMPQAFPQQTGAGAVTNPYAQAQFPQQQAQQPQPIQPNFTGAGFGGYGPQPQQAQFTSAASGFPAAQQQQPQATGFSAQQQHGSPPPQIQPQPTSTNPFRQSMMFTGATMPQATGIQQPQQPQPQIQPQPTSTNPFARHSILSNGTSNGALSPPQPQSGFPQAQAQQPVAVQPTGSTNPFAKPSSPPAQSLSPPSPGGGVGGASSQPQPTGSTNPFRQSIFINQQTGQGWQNAGQGTMGGLEGLDTIAVFPRPGQPSQGQQQGQQQWF